MLEISSRVNPGELAHIIFRREDFLGRQNVVEPQAFLQVAALQLEQSESFRAHVHIWKSLPSSDSVAQESWVVISGEISVSLLDTDGSVLHDDVLGPGDCSITLMGGHRYVASEASLVYEFKSGPYLGHEFDKVYVD